MPIILNTGLLEPNTPKTNGMVERANGIIKKETILKENYANIYIEHCRNKEEMNDALMAFPVYYMLYGRHGGVRKEPGVKNPFQAVEKPVVSKAEPWFMLKPEIFKQNPFIFKNKILCL
jgi:hypothetical protein